MQDIYLLFIKFISILVCEFSSIAQTKQKLNAFLG